MTTLDPSKLQTTILKNVSDMEFHLPRRYTLTHSDLTGDLFLTIGSDYNRPQISGWYTRLMRDEVLAEWKKSQDKIGWSLHIYCHVSGGLIFGSAGWRYSIFNHHMRQVIQAFRYGDRQLVAAHPELDKVAVMVHFRAKQSRYNKVVKRGCFGDYRLEV